MFYCTKSTHNKQKRKEKKIYRKKRNEFCLRIKNHFFFVTINSVETKKFTNKFIVDFFCVLFVLFHRNLFISFVKKSAQKVKSFNSDLFVANNRKRKKKCNYLKEKILIFVFGGMKTIERKSEINIKCGMTF